MPIRNSTHYRVLLTGLVALSFVIGISKAAHSGNHQIYRDPASYLIQKFESHDIVFLGTRHRKPAILQFISELIPRLKNAGVTQHLKKWYGRFMCSIKLAASESILIVLHRI